MNKQYRELDNTLAEAKMAIKLHGAMHKAGIEALECAESKFLAEEDTKLLHVELDKAIHKARIDMLEEAVDKATLTARAVDKATDEVNRLARAADNASAYVAKILELLDDD